MRAGLEVLSNLPSLAEAWAAAGVELDIGIGINSGPVAMGLVGKRHLEPTVIGDAVNLSQRLEALTKEVGYPLVFSEAVRLMLQEEVEAVCLGDVTVVGRQVPVKCYGVAGPKGFGSRAEQSAAIGEREASDEP
jgi:adenylate cyclase